MIPFILEELSLAGVPDRQIRFIAALGCHGALNRMELVKKLGAEVVGRFPVYNHNAFENCVYAGTTGSGTPLYVNEEFMNCSLKIYDRKVVGTMSPLHMHAKETVIGYNNKNIFIWKPVKGGYNENSWLIYPPVGTTA